MVHLNNIHNLTEEYRLYGKSMKKIIQILTVLMMTWMITMTMALMVMHGREQA